MKYLILTLFILIFNSCATNSANGINSASCTINPSKNFKNGSNFGKKD